MIETGERLDLRFEVRAVVDGRQWTGRFADLITKPTIVSVYMRNNTSSCDKQIRQIEEVVERLDTLGCGVIAVSKDTPGSHLKYANKLGLAFPLVADPECQFAQATNSLVEKRMYGRVYQGPTRSAYLIDQRSVLRGVVEKVDAAGHGQQLLELAKIASGG